MCNSTSDLNGSNSEAVVLGDAGSCCGTYTIHFGTLGGQDYLAV